MDRSDKPERAAYAIAALLEALRTTLKACGLGAIVAAALTMQAQATVPPAPLGLSATGGDYALIANSGWRVSTNGGKTFVAAKVVSVLREGNPQSTNAEDRQQVGYIWAPACTASKQTLTFRRTYFLPGPTRTLGIDLWDTVSAVAPGNQVISNVKIYVNGKLAFNLPGAYKRLPVAVRGTLNALFIFGNNVIDVVVEKRAQSGNFGKCSYGTPARPIGLNFIIRGAFQANFWLSADKMKNEETYKKGVGNTQLFVIGGSPRNLGPSGIYSGKLSVEINGGEEITLDPDGPTVTGKGLTNCKLTQPFKQRGLLECDIFKMPAGALPVATFRAIVRFPPNYAVGQVFIARDGYGSSFDPSDQTNGRRSFFYICGPTATNPKCPK